MAKTDFTLIDPPVTPLSPAKDIQKWLGELEGMEQTDEVLIAIDQARAWLKAGENNA